MSDAKVPQATPVAARPNETASQPAPDQKRSHSRTASVTSLALACAITYLAFGSFSPRSSSSSAAAVSFAGPLAGPAAASADASPFADAPYLSWSPPPAVGPSTSAAEPWTDQNCRTLPNLSGGRFLSTVCCASTSGGKGHAVDPEDDATRATLWLVRNDALGHGQEDFRIKGTGLLKAERAERRAGRPVGQSKLARPTASEEGKSASLLVCALRPGSRDVDISTPLSIPAGYRFDFAIPKTPLSDEADYVTPTINAWFQTADPIVRPLGDPHDRSCLLRHEA
jgi:hypothetical protein